ncbi:MAG: bacterio-opsin activator domain-containing protein [Halobacteriota archaeon]|uniref:bacterio-opsin activator domain-containing protein n=1 Tax=Natronomonas sp. TaxID=2184060 RepID=UPI0039765FDA
MVRKRSDIALPDTSDTAVDPSLVPRFGAFLDRANIGLLFADEGLVVTRVNRTIGELLQLPDDAVGKPLGSVGHEIDDEILAAVRDAVQTEAVVEFETMIEGGEHVGIRAVPVADGVTLYVEDASDRIDLRRGLKRSRRILETLDDGVYTLDEAFVITSVNEAVTSMTGYDREELVGSHASMLAGDETLSMADKILEQLRSNGSDIGLIESSIQRKDGSRLPIETRFSTVEFDNGDRQRVGILRDATDRRRHDRTLRELNRSARLLLDADSETTVCETVVSVANSVWPTACVTVYLLDTSSSVLRPVEASGDDPKSRGPGTIEWEAFVRGDGSPGIDIDADVEQDTTVDDALSFRQLSDASGPQFGSTAADRDGPSGYVIERSDDGEPSSERTLFATLAEYGLLRIEFGSEADSETLAEPVELLAANAIAALGRVEREAELSQRREALAERNRRLQRLHGFNDLLRRINGALVEADALEDIGRAVCDHLVSAEGIAFAWLGECYRSGGGIQSVARAGDGGGYLDGLGVLETGAAGSTGGTAEPTHRALDTGDPAVVSNVSSGLHDAQWRERALVRGFQSVTSVPLEYNGLQYGVLSVYADRADAFDGPLGELLEEFGTTVANAINGVEAKRSLQSEALVELDLRIDDPNELLARLSATLDEQLRIDGTVPKGTDRSVIYLRSPVDPDRLTSSAHAVEAVRSVGDDTDPRVEVTVRESTVANWLGDYGVSIEELVADPEGVDATVVLPRTADVRTLVESLGERHPSVELLARHESDVSTAGMAELAGASKDRLTDKQRQALRTAYLSGYFEWPRASTGEEVADALDITQPTFNRHLRTTERKLFSALFED